MEGESDGTLSSAADVVSGIITGIPAPIRKNALRALNRLCTAAVEYPVALIEGAIEEKRAESRARVRLIETSADQIAGQMLTDPEYARAAVTKFGQKILRERINLDRISNAAVDELNHSPETESTRDIHADGDAEALPISDDWLNAFEDEAVKMSSEQMQRLFGKILAGEIRKPTSYSIKTIKLLAQLDNQAAALFKIACSLAASLRVPSSMDGITVDARVISMGNAGSNSLGPYGLSFDALNVLQEYGLIISDYNSYRDFRMSVAQGGMVSLPFIHQGKTWALVPKDPAHESKEFRVYGVAFSRAGKELLSIVDVDSNDQYMKALITYFDRQGMTLTHMNV